MLRVENLETFYGDVHVLKGVDLAVNKGELVAVIGANGAGKTTLINSISGMVKPRRGKIFWEDQEITHLEPYKIVERGVVQVPEGRLLFPNMTVLENLEMGGYHLKSKDVLNRQLDTVYELLPVLKTRHSQMAGTMSGGEQQMVAIGRAMMSNPRLVMFDEPSLGLAPLIVKTVLEMVQHINEQLGVSVLLVEQNVQNSCQISNRAYVMENGEVVLEGPGPSMLDNEHVRRAYLGL